MTVKRNVSDRNIASAKERHTFGLLLVAATFFVIAACSNPLGGGDDAGPPTGAVDETGPTRGGFGSIVLASVADVSVLVRWSAASDDTTPSGQLRYRVYYSSRNDINTPGQAEANGTAANEWQTGITELEVEGLTPVTRYYFNVLVQDSVGNTTAYFADSAVTSSVRPTFTSATLAITTDASGTPTWAWEDDGADGFRYQLVNARDAAADGWILPDNWTEVLSTTTSFTPSEALVGTGHSLYLQQSTIGSGWSASAIHEILVERTFVGNFTTSGAGARPLSDLSGYNIVTGDVTIQSTNTTDFSELTYLARVDGALTLSGNNSATTMAGLSFLESVGGSISVSSNRALTDLAGFGGLTGVVNGDLSILNNGIDADSEWFSNFADLDGITEVTGNLTITNNRVASYTGFASLSAVGGRLRIDSGNGVFDGLNALETVGETILFRDNNFTVVDGFALLSTIPGDLDFGSAGTSFRITGFERLEHVGGNVRLETTVSSLEGFSSLTSIEGFFILSGSVVQNLQGLNELQTARGLQLFFNSELRSLSGLDSLTYVDSEVFLFRNASLQSLQGLAPGGSVDIGELLIGDHQSLTTLDGLQSVSRVRASLIIGNNDALTNVDALSGITEIWSTADATNHSITIDDNQLLANLNGLASTTTNGDGDELIITDNPALPVAEAEAFRDNLLNGGSQTITTVTIAGNQGQ